MVQSSEQLSFSIQKFNIREIRYFKSNWSRKKI